MKRIGFITFDRTPYRILQLNSFSTNYYIKSYYTSINLKNRDWNLPDAKFQEIQINGFIKREKRYLFGLGIWNIVNSNDFLVIGGYDNLSSYQLALCSRIQKKPYFIMIDGLTPDKKVKKNIKFFLKKWIINNSEAIFSNGTLSKEYFVNEFHYDQNKIFNQYLSVDNKAIVDAKSEEPEENILKKLGQKKKNIIYSGRLLPSKNVSIILDAIAYLDNYKQYRLLILGDGPERDNLTKKAKSLGIDMVITGFIKNQKQLFSSYYHGDMLILPTFDDAWGLVVNEAMVAGLPVIVSNKAGCYKDLVKNGANGYTFNPNDPYELSKCISKVYKNGIYEMGKVSEKIISNWTFKNSLESLQKMIEGSVDR